jgi:hypothetical protein
MFRENTYDLPETERFAAVLDAVLELRARNRTAVDSSRNVSFFLATAESARYNSFRDAVFRTVGEGLKQEKLEEALEVIICHCVQLGWQAAKFDSENRNA